MLAMRESGLVGATRKMVSSPAERSQPARGSASSTGTYGISLTSPAARTRSSSRLSRRVSIPRIELHDRIHVLVAAAAHTDQQATIGAQVPRQLPSVVKRMRGLQRRQDALQAAAELER